MHPDPRAGVPPNRVVTATWRHVLISLYCESPTGDDMRGVGSALERLLLRYPKGVLTLAYAKPGIGLPGADAGNVTMELSLKHARRIRGTAIVLPGEGFRSKTARGLVEGVSRVIAIAGATQAVFKNIPQSTAWLLADETDPTIEPGDLADTVHGLADRYGVLEPSAWNDLPLRRSTFRPKR